MENFNPNTASTRSNSFDDGFFNGDLWVSGNAGGCGEIHDGMTMYYEDPHPCPQVFYSSCPPNLYDSTSDDVYDSQSSCVDDTLQQDGTSASPQPPSNSNSAAGSPPDEVSPEADTTAGEESGPSESSERCPRALPHMPRSLNFEEASFKPELNVETGELTIAGVRLPHNHRQLRDRTQVHEMWSSLWEDFDMELLMSIQYGDEEASAARRSSDTFPEFIKKLEVIMNHLTIPLNDRSYRDNFTVNYQALFQSTEERILRPDVLEAAAMRSEYIYVNGKRYDFSPAILAAATELSDQWSNMLIDLDRLLHTSPDATDPLCTDKRYTKFCVIFCKFDAAWAVFEDRYIRELIDIEAISRNYIHVAIDASAGIDECSDHPSDQDLLTYREAKFVENINFLNSVCNKSRKGRQDLPHRILIKSRDIVKHENLPVSVKQVAVQVIKTWDLFRGYLREAGMHMARLDPHLQNNKVLSSVCEALEESWESGMTFLQDDSMLEALKDLAIIIETAQNLWPQFKQDCSDMDVNVMIIIPRLVLVRAALSADLECPFLKMLLEEGDVQRVKEILNNINHDRERLIWGALADSYDLPEEFKPTSEVSAIFKKLDSFSMQLQRCHATEWNEMIKVLLDDGQDSSLPSVGAGEDFLP